MWKDAASQCCDFARHLKIVAGHGLVSKLMMSETYQVYEAQRRLSCFGLPVLIYLPETNACLERHHVACGSMALQSAATTVEFGR